MRHRMADKTAVYEEGCARKYGIVIGRLIFRSLVDYRLRESGTKEVMCHLLPSMTLGIIRITNHEKIETIDLK
jgi:hypothetical protein